MIARPLLSVLLRSLLLLGSSEQLGPASESLEQGLEVAAAELAKRMTAGGVHKIAVVEFADLNGYVSALGQFIAEEMTTAFFVVAQDRGFDVVERRELARVLKEQELTSSSLFDAETIARIGKILGIEALVTGSIADLGTEIKINARAISVETARVFTAASATIPKEDRVLELMRQSAGGGRAAPGSQPADLSPRRQLQRADVFVANSFLHIEVTAIARSEDKKTVTLSLAFLNKSRSDLYLALDARNYTCRASVIDNTGTMPRLLDDDRIQVNGLTCLGTEADRRRKASYSRFAPGATTPVIFGFELKKREFSGDIFSFSAELLVYDAQEWSRISVGIGNIELQR
jgi:TolB-like protein